MTPPLFLIALACGVVGYKLGRAVSAQEFRDFLILLLDPEPDPHEAQREAAPWN